MVLISIYSIKNIILIIMTSLFGKIVSVSVMFGFINEILNQLGPILFDVEIIKDKQKSRRV